MKSFKILVTLPDYLYNEVKSIADLELRSMSNVVYKILLEKFKWDWRKNRMKKLNDDLDAIGIVSIQHYIMKLSNHDLLLIQKYCNSELRQRLFCNER